MGSVTLRDGLRLQHWELQQVRGGFRGLGFLGLG